MASIYIENVPDDLYARLQERAAADNRSVESEVVALLEHAVAESENGTGNSEEERLAEIFRRASEWTGPYEWFPEPRTDAQVESGSGAPVPTTWTNSAIPCPSRCGDRVGPWNRSRDSSIAH